jgi:hypothetical protein
MSSMKSMEVVYVLPKALSAPSLSDIEVSAEQRARFWRMIEQLSSNRRDPICDCDLLAKENMIRLVPRHKCCMRFESIESASRYLLRSDEITFQDMDDNADVEFPCQLGVQPLHFASRGRTPPSKSNRSMSTSSTASARLIELRELEAGARRGSLVYRDGSYMPYLFK